MPEKYGHPEEITEPLGLSRPQAARLIGVSAAQIIRLEREDPTFPSVRVGGRIVIPRDELLTWFRSHRVPKGPAVRREA